MNASNLCLPERVDVLQLLGRVAVSASWIDADAVRADLEAARAGEAASAIGTTSSLDRDVPALYGSLPFDDRGSMELFHVPPAVLLRDAKLSSPARFAIECSLPECLPSSSRTSVSQHQYCFVVACKTEGAATPCFVKCPVRMHRRASFPEEEQWGPRQPLGEAIIFRAYRCDDMWCQRWEAGLEVRVPLCCAVVCLSFPLISTWNYAGVRRHGERNAGAGARAARFESGAAWGRVDRVCDGSRG